MPMSNLHRRVLEPEDIDDPRLEREELFGALRGLARINFLSASAHSVWSPLARLARGLGRKQLRVLDVATGAGDIPLALWQKGKRAGLKLEILGIDISERALEFAESRVQSCGSDVRFERRDVLQQELPHGFDAIVSSLFLHHLTNDQAQQLLGSMARAAHHLVLVNDLRRGRYGLTLAHLAARLLASLGVVGVDGVRGVRAAFALSEARQMAEAAGMAGVQMSRRWPARFLLTWEKKFAKQAPLNA